MGRAIQEGGGKVDRVGERGRSWLRSRGVLADCVR
jgi:hypothetical protein